jgi:hypothetical protein
VLRLFENIPDEDAGLLCLNSKRTRPDDLLVRVMGVPPLCIRPSVDLGPSGSQEDDLTTKLADVVYINNFIRMALEKGAAPSVWQRSGLRRAALTRVEGGHGELGVPAAAGRNVHQRGSTRFPADGALRCMQCFSRAVPWLTDAHRRQTHPRPVAAPQGKAWYGVRDCWIAPGA